MTAALKALHWGEVEIAGHRIPCAVLEDGTPVITQRGVMRLLGYRHGGSHGTGEGGAQLPRFLASESVKPFISERLRLVLNSPFRYTVEGTEIIGHAHDVITQICGTLVRAGLSGKLKKTQQPMAQAASLLLEHWSADAIKRQIFVGLGYIQDPVAAEVRARIGTYVTPDFRPHVARFDDTFFREVYRLHGWAWRAGVTQGPRYVGKLINQYVYKRLPDGVLDRLREVNPAENGQRKRRHHQHLTQDLGARDLDRVIIEVRTLMRVSATLEDFEDRLRSLLPAHGEQPCLLLPPTRKGDR